MIFFKKSRQIRIFIFDSFKQFFAEAEENESFVKRRGTILIVVRRAGEGFITEGERIVIRRFKKKLKYLLGCGRINNREFEN